MRNTDECLQMFDEMVNCVGDIFLHKYVLFHVNYHSHDRYAHSAYLRFWWIKIWPKNVCKLTNPQQHQNWSFWFCDFDFDFVILFMVLQIVTHVKQEVFMQGDISNAICRFVKNLCISKTKPFRTHVYINFLLEINQRIALLSFRTYLRDTLYSVYIQGVYLPHFLLITNSWVYFPETIFLLWKCREVIIFCKLSFFVIIYFCN